ncbi:coat protein [ssRNA phage Zoerhiza.3_2]|uniref:Coat protein n=2 Tax=Norzivirales TaxID=2842247 RepID=A0A8S5L4L0_9VIRU|nr:coat protein [ssRNA phage Zoerhiza.3_2]QDH89783.1 MAG: hypothetical protein H3Rhizo37124_000003 [Leviviridae sp.]DAD52130.1 TPA_asm: coat protein [ssRNA phage Zoerhiza.3_2]
MTIPVSSPVTGGAQTGFTSPTYTVVTDKAPDVNSNQYAVTALGGTQASVRTHTVSDPFTISVSKPKNPRTLPSPNPVTGKYGDVPFNRTSILVRKGLNFAANNAPLVGYVRIYIDVPAGADAYDAANVRAMLSLAVGEVNTQSAGIGDSAVTGVI